MTPNTEMNSASGQVDISDRERIEFLERSLMSDNGQRSSDVLEYEQSDENDDESWLAFTVRGPFVGGVAKLGDGPTLRDAIDHAIKQYKSACT